MLRRGGDALSRLPASPRLLLGTAAADESSPVRLHADCPPGGGILRGLRYGRQSAAPGRLPRSLGIDPRGLRGSPLPTFRGPDYLAVKNAAAGHDLARYVRHGVDWSVRVARDLGSVIQSTTSALARRTGSNDREIRKRLGALWPLIVVDVALRTPHMIAGPDHGPYDVYDRDATREVAFEVTLQNALAGIAPLRGSLEVRFFDPRGGLSRRSESPSGCSFVIPLDLTDRTTCAGAWSGDARGFTPGLWRIEFCGPDARPAIAASS